MSMDLTRRDVLKKSGIGLGAALVGGGLLAGGSSAASLRGLAEGGWAKGIDITFFAGGGSGDLYASVVANGAKQAAKDLGCNLKIMYSNWSASTEITQLNQIIATKPDGIAMDGSPGDAALMPLAKKAAAAGVLMTYWDVDPKTVRAAYGGGYAGADLYSFGFNLGTQAIEQFKLKAGDRALVYGFFASTGFGVRDNGVADGLKKGGLNIVKIAMPVESGSNPQSITPLIAGGLAKYKDAKLMSLSGGQWVGTSPAYLKAAGKKPGEVKVISFDFLPSVVTAMDGNWAQMTANQQPFLQGYNPVLQLCLAKKWGFQPTVQNTATAFMTPDNYKKFVPLAQSALVG